MHVTLLIDVQLSSSTVSQLISHSPPLPVSLLVLFSKPTYEAWPYSSALAFYANLGLAFLKRRRNSTTPCNLWNRFARADDTGWDEYDALLNLADPLFLILASISIKSDPTQTLVGP